jgi:hypothetical protein
MGGAVMGIGMSIVFTGLCALVTDGERGSGQVLLVDAQGVGEVRGVKLPEHSPTLAVSLASLVNAESSGPTRVVTTTGGQLGLWDLRGSEVRIVVQGANADGLRAFQAPPGTSSWPEPPPNPNDPAAWRDLRFVADMKPLAGDGRVDPALVSTQDGTSLPGAVATRIYLDSGVMEAGIPSEPAHRDDVFEFDDASGLPRLRQALTDSLRWNLDTDASAVVIEIRPVAGGPTKRLVLRPSETRHDIYVSNLPAENALHDTHRSVSIEEMAALHFGAYYRLLRHQPEDQPLPRLWVPSDSQGAGVIGPVVCPPATFTRN